MADYYCDHGAYASALGTTPTWGVPQEGDGSSKDAATAASIASILLNAQPAAGNLLSICGISFGATSGGTINYTIGGTLTATVDNIVASINGCTTAVGTTVAVGAPQLRNLVFARNSGGNTVQIMMRVGSATLNHSVNTSVAITQSGWGTAPTITNFAGGSGGCWGWLVNTAAIGVSSSIAAVAYGVMVAVPMVRTATLTEADVVWARTGDNPTLTFSGSSFSLGRSVTTSGASAYPLNLIFDTNTKWTSDSTTGTCTFNLTLSGAFTAPGIYSLSSYGNMIAFASSLIALREGNVVFNVTSSVAGETTLGQAFANGTSPSSSNQNFYTSGVWFFDNSTGTNHARLKMMSSGTGNGQNALGEFVYRRCRFVRTNQISGVSVTNFTVANNSNLNNRLRFYGCSFESNVSGATVNPIVDISVANCGPSFGTSIRFNQCSFSGFSGGGNVFPLHNSATSLADSTGAGFVIEATDCTGVSLAASYAGLAATNATSSIPDTYRIMLHSPTLGGPFRFENMKGIVEFNPGASPAQPTLAAIQPSGSAWSIHARWLATATVVNRGMGWALPPLRLSYVDTSAIRTVKTQVFLSSALFSTLVPGDFVATLSYVSNTTGLIVSQSLLIPATSAASWVGAAGYPSHVAREFSFVTSQPIRQGTEVAVQIELSGAPRTASAESVFIDPEFSIT